MQYVLIALLLFAAFVLFYKIVLPIGEPNLHPMPILTDEELKVSVIKLAAKMKDTTEECSLSSVILRKSLKRGYKSIGRKIARGDELFDFERWIFDNYYRLTEGLAEQKAATIVYASLPGFNGVPKIYKLAELLVKCGGGVVTSASLKTALSAYNAVLPLTINEVNALSTMIEFVLLESVAIYTNKAVFINRKLDTAKKDIINHKIDLNLLKYNSYAYAFTKFADSNSLKRFNDICIDNGLSAYEKAENFMVLSARYAGEVSNSIISLHKLKEIFADDFILSVCPVSILLASEKDIVYSQCDAATKYIYRENISKKAKKKKISELAFSRRLIAEARAKNIDIAELILPRPCGTFGKVVYILLIIGYTVSNCVTAYMYLPELKIFSAIIFLPISLELVLVFAVGICKILFKRRFMPRIDIVPQSSKAMILFSRLVANAEEVDDAFANLKTAACTNREKIFSYGLLLDFAPSTKPHTEEDFQIIEACKRNYSCVGKNFNVFLRTRNKIKGEEKYQGWEKKRGALMELNRLILSGDKSRFEIVEGNTYEVKYIIALDSDTMLNCAYDLVRVMEHPYNADKAIASISMRTEPSTVNTPFAALMSGAIGLNGYPIVTPDVEYDIFGVGNFTGKGIYNVQKFTERLEGKLPENRILSHDFLEGCIAGCGNSNESAVDTFPADFSSFLTRNLRWLRGDWQLLPYLFGKVKNEEGEKIKNPVGAIGRMHILFNIILGLVPLAQLVLLFASLVVREPIYMLLAAFSLNILLVFGGISKLFKNPKGMAMDIMRQVMRMAFLAVNAYYYSRSIIITIIRLIKKEKLLEWKVFAHSNARVSMAANLIVSIIFAFVCFFRFDLTFIAIITLFMSGILIDYVTSKQIKSKKIDNDEAKTLLSLARKTWKYFQLQLDEKNNYLPFDNLQIEPDNGFAPRTSPTDIAFALTSVICSHRLGFIDYAEASESIYKILNVIDKMEKWQGNLFNWVDVYTLKRLNGYVSAVDSGNLLAALILTNNFLGGKDCLSEKLIEQMDLGAFYDGRRNLLRIGYDADSGVFDNNHYDLLGSESLLTYLVAIGYGKIPKTAFYSLNKRCVRYRNNTALYSWTGGIFEYLMPRLFFVYPRSGLLECSAKTIVLANIKYAKKSKTPFWGMSESQYARLDENGNYQYKAFGVDALALSGENSGSVVAPYASALGMLVNYNSAYKNILNIKSLGGEGEYGLYESFDGCFVKTFMAHHQGMLLAAFTNVLLDGEIYKLMDSPQMRAAKLLISGIDVPLKSYEKPRFSRAPAPRSYICETQKRTIPPAIMLMGNGKYFVVIDELGRGYSYFNGNYVFRYDSVECGQGLYAICGDKTLNLTQNNVLFANGIVKFITKAEDLVFEVNCCVLPTVNGEMREIEITNTGKTEQNIAIYTLLEPTLCPLYQDISHKIFSSFFIEAETLGDVVFVKRKGKKLIMAHYFDVSAEYTLSRSKIYGKNDGVETAVSGNAQLFIPSGQKKKIRIFNLLSNDREYLLRAIKLTKNEGYFGRIKESCFSLNRSLSVGMRTRDIFTCLFYLAKPNVSGIGDSSLPLVCFDFEKGISFEQRNDLKELYRCKSFGLEFNLVAIYNDDGEKRYIKEKLLSSGIFHDTMQPIFINKAYDPSGGVKAKESSTPLTLTYNKYQEKQIEKRLPYENAPITSLSYAYKTGIGGFLQNGTFAIDESAPRPWSNVLGNGKIGAIITDTGGGFSFGDNSREKKYTEWANDIILDRPSEGVILGENGNVWSISRKPLEKDAVYQVFHSFGYTEFRCNYNGIIGSQKVFLNGRTKIMEITLINALSFERNIDCAYFIKPVLGDFYFKTKHNLACEFLPDENVFSVKNVDSDLTLFMSCDHKITDYVCHKQGYTDLNGNIYLASGFINQGVDIAPIISSTTILPPFGRATIKFGLGEDKNVLFENTASALRNEIDRFSNLSRVEMDFKSQSLNYLSKWLPYQCLTSRFYARAGYYQAGGAIGFRDQLQDCLTLLYVDPMLVREHILLCSAHQFESGDVQHWWHPPKTGVRTKIMDDRLFLPLLTAKYIEFTDDSSILLERTPFLVDKEFSGKDIYFTPQETTYSATLYAHCVKAIDSSLNFAENGLLFMGSGDWNDAMDNVGVKGKGSTVWGSMFLYYVINEFLPYLKSKAKYMAVKDKLRDAVDKSWDGEWYTRAYTDDGKVLGSKKNEECSIDLITQSFACISGIAPMHKAKLALYSAAKKLVDTEHGIIKLLSPPITKLDVGYIKDYPPGVRENGGQYTHGAVWFILALIKAGEVDYAYSLLELINPINHCLTRSDAEKYAAEPYVISADVYANPPGKAGWSWYTGGASWLYYVIVRYFLGIKFTGDVVEIKPNLPRKIREVKVCLNEKFGKVRILIQNEGDGTWCISIDGKCYNTSRIALTKGLGDKKIIVKKA